MSAPKIPATVRIVSDSAPGGFEVINASDFQEGVHERLAPPATPAPAAPAVAPAIGSAPPEPGTEDARTDLSAVSEDLKAAPHKALQAIAKGYGLPSVGLTRDALVAMIEDHRRTTAAQA